MLTVRTIPTLHSPYSGNMLCSNSTELHRNAHILFENSAKGCWLSVAIFGLEREKEKGNEKEKRGERGGEGDGEEEGEVEREGEMKDNEDMRKRRRRRAKSNTRLVFFFSDILPQLEEAGMQKIRVSYNSSTNSLVNRVLEKTKCISICCAPPPVLRTLPSLD